MLNIYINVASLSFPRKQSARRRWWTSNSRLTPRWPTPNESWSCRKLLSTRKSTRRWASKNNVGHLRCVCASETWRSVCWSVQKAEAQLAYELQAAKEQQKIRLEEIEIQVVQRKKEITIEEKEIARTDKELIATVKRPAEAEAYKMQQLAEGHKWVWNCRLKSFMFLSESQPRSESTERTSTSVLVHTPLVLLWFSLKHLVKRKYHSAEHSVLLYTNQMSCSWAYLYLKSIPLVFMSKCRSVLGQDTEPQTAPCMAATTISVWMYKLL